MILIHLIDRKTWEEIKHHPILLDDVFRGNGFIHCCMPAQVQGVMKQWFPDKLDMLALEIETDLLKSTVIHENLEGGEEKFPHIYGPVNREAVVKWHLVSNHNEEILNEG